MAGSELVTIQPKLARIEREGVEMLEQVRAIRISNQDEYEATGTMRQIIKSKLTALEEFIGPIKKAQYDAWKVSCGQEAKVSNPLQQADGMLVQKRVEWTRALEEARLREIRARIEQEQAEASERLAEEAAERAQAGDVAGAMEMLEERVVVPVQAIAKEVEPVQKQSGFSERKTWSAEVVDLKELIKAVAEGRAPVECLAADMKFLNKQASAFRGGLQIPGVKAVSRTSESVRGRAMDIQVTLADVSDLDFVLVIKDSTKTAEELPGTSLFMILGNRLVPVRRDGLVARSIFRDLETIFTVNE